ncbi:MAG: hypothetical protein JW893_05410 [Candidatus Omnitrophica bacterium]|nr:hypothetical protein [Candidatus Omnitrophota bacterium]
MDKKPCDQCDVHKLFHQYLDRDLSNAKAEELEAFLKEYQKCAKHFQMEKELRDQLKEKMNSSKLPPDIRKKIFDQLS